MPFMLVLCVEEVAFSLEQHTSGDSQDNSTTLTQVTLPPPSLNFSRRVWAFFRALRPRQWTKNGAIFIGLVFAQELFVPMGFLRTLIAFVIFCFASSIIYLLNDLMDLEKDRQHPTKCRRPLASGALPTSWAIVGIGILFVLCAALATLLYMLPFPGHGDSYGGFGGANLLFVVIIASYLLIMVLYSVRLKHVVLIDVFIIAGGFVLRIMAGAVAVPVYISPWLYLVTSFLSLFLALSKRRHELILLQDQAVNHRSILKEYSIPMLDQMITIAVTATLLAYSLYTIQSPTGSQRLALTIPFVLYGMFRYLYLVYMRMEGGSPEEVLLRDPHMLGTVFLCTVLVVVILYVIPHLAIS